MKKYRRVYTNEQMRKKVIKGKIRMKYSYYYDLFPETMERVRKRLMSEKDNNSHCQRVMTEEVEK